MSLKDKNLFFYSSDQNSKQFLDEISKNVILKKNFVLVNTCDQNIKIPEKIKSLGVMPVLIICGFNKPITGGEVLTWIKSNMMSTCNNHSTLPEVKFGTFNDISNKFSLIENAANEQIVNKSYSSINDSKRIVTYEEPESHCKKDIGETMAKRLSLLKAQRDIDIPKSNGNLKI
jgi:hypothetical protein